MKKLGFGMMRLPLMDNADPKSIDIELTKKMVDRFIEEGFTYFDTAYVYHNGEAEKAFGIAVADRYPRDSYTITTKCPIMEINTSADYERVFREQLENCHVDYFDYYFLHAMRENRYEKFSRTGGFEFLKELKKQGRVRNIGFSFHDKADFLERILNEHPETDIVQIQYNYLDEDDINIESGKCLEVCRKHGVFTAIMEPLKGGTLVNIPEEAKDIFRKAAPGSSIASWGIRYAATPENVNIVLSGMSNMEQLEDNMSYMKDFVPMNDEEKAVIKESLSAVKACREIPCTACNYCTPGCPMEIPIPEYFAFYNTMKFTGMNNSVRFNYQSLSSVRPTPEACIGCGQCESQCPQNIQIIDYLKKTADAFADNKKYCDH